MPHGESMKHPSVHSLTCLILLVGITSAARAESLLERGDYLVNSVMSCGLCHTPRGPAATNELSGGSQTFEDPAYVVKGSNITPDPETGIGRWTAADIKRALTEGVRPDGSPLAPSMPSQFFKSLTSRDLDAVVAYVRSVPAVTNRVPAPVYRGAMPAASGLDERAPPALVQDDRLIRGRYLSDLAHCMDCHARGADGKHDFAGGLGKGGYVMKGPFGAAPVPNITSHPTAGIGRWTDEEVRRALTLGVSRDGRPLLPPMARSVYFSRMTATDLDALVAYVRALPPLE